MVKVTTLRINYFFHFIDLLQTSEQNYITYVKLDFAKDGSHFLFNKVECR